MSSVIRLTWDQLDEGVRRDPWEAWAAAHDLVLNSGNSAYYLRGDAWIEAVYKTRRDISFRTQDGPGMVQATGLALDLWAQYGGALHAPPEVTRLIRVRLDAMSRLLGAIAAEVA